jgi:hypothetical protein
MRAQPNPGDVTLAHRVDGEQNHRMAGAVVLPVRGDVFLDARDAGRAMRLSWHHEGELVVMSLWREHACVGTFQLTKDDVPALVESLVNGLAQGYRGRHADASQAV